MQEFEIWVPKLPPSYDSITYKFEIGLCLEDAKEMESAPVSFAACKRANELLADIVDLFGKGLLLEEFSPTLRANLDRLMEAGDNICLKASFHIREQYADYRSFLPQLDLAPHYDA